MKKRWSDLSERNRRIITIVAIVEAALKAAMLIDLKRRPAEQVKGSKRMWAFSTIVNSAGIIPLVYFIFGRRKRQGVSGFSTVVSSRHAPPDSGEVVVGTGVDPVTSRFSGARSAN